MKQFGQVALGPGRRCKKVDLIEVCFYPQKVDLPSKRIKDAIDVVELMHQLKLCESSQEEFHCVYLNAKNNVLGVRMVTRGIETEAPVSPSVVFRPAITLNAPFVIACHNHPSGDPEPSLADRNLTIRLHEAGRMLGVRLLDHVVIGMDKKYFSFSHEGLLPQ